jgi:protein-disulfide isomerase
MLVGDMHQNMPAARWRAAALLAAILGAAASAYLLVEYVTGQPGLCLTGSGCDLVRASAFAYPLGIPTPLIGLVFYVAALWLAVRTLVDRPIAGVRIEVALAALAVAGAAASAILTGLEAFVIHAYCSWCLVQAAASLGLLLAAMLLMASPTERVVAHSSRTRQLAARARESERSRLLLVGQVGGGVATLALAGLLVLGAASATPSVSPPPSGLAPAGSPRLGTGTVEVVEFADFECPGCAALAPILADLASANEMTLVSRYFPLDSLHPNADRSARAAAAANQQGSFWQMSAAVYARQDAWKDLSPSDADAFFNALAGELGLNVAEWQAAYTSSEIEAAVNVDRQAAVGLGLTGTPSLFIGGSQYTGPLSTDGIRAALAAAS